MRMRDVFTRSTIMAIVAMAMVAMPIHMHGFVGAYRNAAHVLGHVFMVPVMLTLATSAFTLALTAVQIVLLSIVKLIDMVLAWNDRTALRQRPREPNHGAVV
jgi:hypothetical protein